MATEIWAHRGSGKSQVENTMAAFEQAVADGAEGIELDVQRSRDGKLVVFHDENLKRLTGKDSYLATLDWDDLKRLNVAANRPEAGVHHMPLLREVLSFIKGKDLKLNIELKNSNVFYPGMDDEVLALVEKMGVLEQVHFSSFNHMSMSYLASKGYGKQSGMLYSEVLCDPWVYVGGCGMGAIHPMFNNLQVPDLVKNCHEAGLKVNVWTIDEEVFIQGALLLEVDAIITNVPVKAIELRNQYIKDGGLSALQCLKESGLLDLIG
ncbi:MAG: glycerophosphodiester phosphodiesterase family protein [Eubacteriales bacterium]|nr:glycerophosphodiester phosphodiesterase family protein [Eubacteriales bacterium]MDD4323578.1 glycerophosphodiester phosphodiesterase family protein [Eubacteriales bacterium]MDD4541081.1 glycerophosphodiester phosphodiesterase family protein [Eubacteriales bacterium]